MIRQDMRRPRAWAALRSLFDVIQRVGVEGEPEPVFEMIEQDLRARVSKPLASSILAMTNRIQINDLAQPWHRFSNSVRGK